MAPTAAPSPSEEPPIVSALRAAAQASVGIAAAVVGWSALKEATGATAADLAAAVFVKETAVRLLGGSGAADAGRVYHFDDYTHRGTRTALSVCVWVPAFSGALFAVAKTFLQLDHVDTIVSRRRRRESEAAASADDAEQAAAAAAKLAAKAKPPSPLMAAHVSEPADAALPRRARPQPAAQQPVASRAPPAVPKIRLAEAPATTSANGRAPSHSRPRRTATPDRDSSEESSSPPSAASRAPDTVALAVATPCSLLEINALLTAAAKYGVGQVVVPHGSQRRDSNGKVNFGLTPRPGSVTNAPTPSMAHVTSRTLEFIGRFQRTVHLSEVDTGVNLPDFIVANRGSLNTSLHPLVTVAVHRRPVPGAVYMRDFEHPPNAVYCFAREPSSPNRANANATPAALARTSSSATAPFASPLKMDGTPTRGGTFEAHAAAAAATPTTGGPTPDDSFGDSAAQAELAFCDLHVYLRDDGRQTLAAVVNVTLYDRAVKMRRAALAA
uniref:Uncharacterized protein n=1 Tax=Neobodo designis TaxID=312471 RepID=A0A6U4SNA0_NEODS|mmetsp:Transcript_30857/g.95282  ORF Transcript_30857/g.95282 Transcript_30857/m.95282 type:complete len:499 (+) Transcript_30857:59-1555(+)|eukprot:CAMPEP_0174827816 /NCGR_PEP_ID=MMETSP1114-20130205/942_1 /TAXON_ID=312471 /ORGANISM="Neobodo designis, Strain CCAP 1951/1" /LENGTH=498 /DNA_ID=CAMNT_0016061493 /DNA_START=38 /DNA_END=1534 /DNA_ORIENTATION=-